MRNQAIGCALGFAAALAGCGGAEESRPVATVDSGVVDSAVAPDIAAIVAGLCTGRAAVHPPTAKECPDPATLVDCATAHCGLSACLAECSDYVACLERASDPCASSALCPQSASCTACANQVVTCAIRGACVSAFSCGGPVAPGGPCSRLEACCMMQVTNVQSCNDAVQLVKGFGGDPGCFGLTNDNAFLSGLSIPCNLD